jgi:hypothetical protein
MRRQEDHVSYLRYQAMGTNIYGMGLLIIHISRATGRFSSLKCSGQVTQLSHSIFHPSMPLTYYPALLGMFPPNSSAQFMDMRRSQSLKVYMFPNNEHSDGPRLHCPRSARDMPPTEWTPDHGLPCDFSRDISHTPLVYGDAQFTSSRDPEVDAVHRLLTRVAVGRPPISKITIRNAVYIG